MKKIKQRLAATIKGKTKPAEGLTIDVTTKGTLHHQFTNSMRITKGKTSSGFNVFAWDVVDVCRGEQCKLHTSCPYRWKTLVNNGSPCSVQAKYVLYVLQRLYDFVPEDAHNIVARIGTELLPLYGHLIKFKMVEHEMRLQEGSSVFLLDDKGKVGINPIYKEIRATISTINSVWAGINASYGQHKKLQACQSGVQKGMKEIMDGSGEEYLNMLMGNEE